MGIAAFTGNRVHRFHVFRAKIVKNFAHQADSFVFRAYLFHGGIQIVIRRVYIIADMSAADSSRVLITRASDMICCHRPP